MPMATAASASALLVMPSRRITSSRFTKPPRWRVSFHTSSMIRLAKASNCTGGFAMSLLLFVAIVLVVTVLVMWLISYVPVPPGAPSWVENVVYIVVLIIALIVILGRAGWLAAPR